MARFVVYLSLLALLLMAVVMTLGLSLGEFRTLHKNHQELATELNELDAAYAPDQSEIDRHTSELNQLKPTMQRATLHRMLGLATAIFVILVNSIVVTYFVGSSRWCKEVGDTYDLEAELTNRSTILKRKTFPWAVIGMLTAVVISGLGAASDPMARFGREHELPYLHLTAAMLGTLIIAYSFFIAWANISENYVIIQRVLVEVKRIRTERGLDIE